MRPPRIAAEYSWTSGSSESRAKRFNEAAANRGGILGVPFARGAEILGFNEAAANRGGIRAGNEPCDIRGTASMRPPRIAAEYSRGESCHDDLNQLQ